MRFAIAAIAIFGCLAIDARNCSAFPDGKAAGTLPAVVSGRVIDEQGEFLRDVRIQITRLPIAHAEDDIESVDDEVVAEAKTGKDGRYEVRVPVAGKAAGFQVQASKPGYRSCDAIGRYGGAISWVGLRPGHQQGASFVLRPGLYVAGIVVDEQGSPLGGVHIDSGSSDAY
jgi:hypothetical protein